MFISTIFLSGTENLIRHLHQPDAGSHLLFLHRLDLARTGATLGECYYQKDDQNGNKYQQAGKTAYVGDLFPLLVGHLIVTHANAAGPPLGLITLQCFFIPLD